MLGTVSFEILIFRHEFVGDTAIVDVWLESRLACLGVIRFFNTTPLMPNIAVIILSTLDLLLLAEFSLSVKDGFVERLATSCFFSGILMPCSLSFGGFLCLASIPTIFFY